MGSEKRERQREARLEKLEAEAAAARRARTKRRGIRLAVAVVVIGAGLFAYSLIAGGDDDDEASGDESTPTTMASTACAPGTPPPEEWTNPTVAEEVLSREAPDLAPPPAETAPTDLQTETVTEGEGEGAVPGDCVWVNYIGNVPDGTVFDESFSGGQPFPVLLGQGSVIPGWDQGLVGAKLGERRRLVIGSDNAYGAQGSPPAIQPNTPLAFEVDIIDVVPTELSDPAAATSSTAPADAATSSTAAADATSGSASGEATTTTVAQTSSSAPES